MKKSLLFLLVVSFILLSGCIQEKEKTTKGLIEGIEKVGVPSTIPKEGLGSLCSGEEECISFCLNNSGRCQAYCKGNTHQNELCLIIFPPGAEDERFQQKENCSDDVRFTYYLVDPKYILSLSQIGSVGGANQAIVGRSYIAVKDEFTNQKVPIYAPTDMVLAYTSYYTAPNPVEGFLPDYGLSFEIKCGKRMSLSHIKEVIPQIKEKLPATPQIIAYNHPMNIEFKVGELIGYYIKGPGSVAFDFIVDDAYITNQFANQERYEAGHGLNTLHSICPYDLYTGAMREAYYNLLPGKNCGTMERDKAGTIAGLWFLNPDPSTGAGEFKKEGMYGNPLPIAMSPERISIGHIGADNIIWIYPNNPTYKDPEEITKEYCYQDYPQGAPLGYVYFKIVDEMTMDVYYSETGRCPSSFPSAGEKRYYR